MTPPMDRRTFIKGSALALGASSIARESRASSPAIISRETKPKVISSANGHPHCVSLAFEKITAGTPVVDAVVAGVSLVEADPKDRSVGLGGIPNEDGVVELDASVMDGPTCNSGAVGALRDILHASQVALRVMRYTDHCLLVGEGARRFAIAHGFKPQNLLTEESRRDWLRWKSRLSDKDDWLPEPPEALTPQEREARRHGGTINCDGIDAKGNLAGVTTTSGLAYKIPGRVGDSPIIGAGLYVDNRVGAAGSTGRGEANIITCGSATVVEGMRQGMHPKDACLYACRRIADMTVMKYLLRDDGRPAFDVKFYALDKKGRHGGGSIWGRGRFAVCDENGPRLEELAGLYER